MTEQEAKERWCPMSRSGEDSNNRGFEGTIFSQDSCIASACMMWRWIILPLDCKEQKCKEAIGYCGLAGKP